MPDSNNTSMSPNSIISVKEDEGIRRNMNCIALRVQIGEFTRVQYYTGFFSFIAIAYFWAIPLQTIKTSFIVCSVYLIAFVVMGLSNYLIHRYGFLLGLLEDEVESYKQKWILNSLFVIFAHVLFLIPSSLIVFDSWVFIMESKTATNFGYVLICLLVGSCLLYVSSFFVSRIWKD